MTGIIHDEPTGTSPGRFVGIAWVLLHTIFLASVNVLVKFLTLPPEEILFMRCCVQFLVLFPTIQFLAYRHGLRVFIGTGALKPLLIRGVLGSLGSLCLYQAIALLSLGDAVSINFTNVVFAGILGKIFLKESYAKFDFFCSLLSLGGVMLIAKPAFIFGADEQTYGLHELIGIGLILVNACGFAACLIAVRSMGNSNPILNVFYFTWCGVWISGGYMAFMGSFYVPCATELALIVLLSCVGIGSQLAMTKALETERASFVAIIRSLQLVLVFIVQVRVVCLKLIQFLSVYMAFMRLLAAVVAETTNLYNKASEVSVEQHKLRKCI